MGVGIVDAAAVEPVTGAVPTKEIVGVVQVVSALAQHGAAVFFADAAGGILHIRRGADGHIR